MYFIPYLLLSLIFLFLWLVEKRNHKKELSVRFTCLFIFVVFFSFRGFVAWDWISYYDWFNLPNDEQILNVCRDKGFAVFMIIVRFITDDYHVFIFINSIIDLYLLHKIFNEYAKYNYALMFFLYFTLYIDVEMDMLRNIKSILLFFYSLRFVKTNTKIYLILNIVGLLMHSSSIIYFILSLFIFKQFNRRLVLVLFVLGNVLFLTQMGVFSALFRPISSVANLGEFQFIYEAYSNSERYSAQYGVSYGYVEKLISFIFIYSYSSRIIKYDQRLRPLVNMYYFFVLLGFYFSDFMIIVGRGGLLLRFSYIILFPALLQVIRIGQIRKMYIIFISLYLLSRMVLVTNNIMYEYENVLTGAHSFWERKYKVNDYVIDKV